MGVCTVYIWLPENGNTGHGAMEIGSGMNTTYVSFWPANDGDGKKVTVGVHSVFNQKYNSDFMEDLADDNYSEGKSPDHTYTIAFSQLDENAMVKCWSTKFCGKSKYQLLSHNCCSVVVEVMRAGGMEIAAKPSKLSKALWMPKSLNKYLKKLDVAQEQVRKKHGSEYAKKMGGRYKMFQ